MYTYIYFEYVHLYLCIYIYLCICVYIYNQLKNYFIFKLKSIFYKCREIYEQNVNIKDLLVSILH